MSTIVIASGGTGGHLYPTVAIAEAIRAMRPDIQIVFIGTSDRIESREVPRLGFDFYPIEIQAPRKSVRHLLRFPIKFWQAYRRSLRILCELDAKAFLGGGAYLSVPVAYAAKKKNIPIAILEINAVVGRANRIIAPRADRLFISYPEAKKQFSSSLAAKTQVIGTPIRDSLKESILPATGRDHFGLDPDRKTLLVFGGSLGARSLNEAMRLSAQHFLDAGLNVIWQTGASANIVELQEAFPESSRICIRQYISEMPEAYAASDLVVARAGASTLAELSTLGKAAILVPYPLAAMNHQEKNANSFRDRGAARVILDGDIVSSLQNEVLKLMGDDTQRNDLAKKMLADENITARNVVAKYLIEQFDSKNR